MVTFFGLREKGREREVSRTAVFSSFPTELGPKNPTIVFYALENPPVDHNLTS